MRLFVALWPDEATRSALDRYAHDVRARGRKVAAGNLHMTLAFLGKTPADAVPAIARAVREARPQCVELSLDKLGYFRNAGALWLGCRVVPTALLDYQQRLCIGLRAAGCVLEKRGFKPHVTLKRDCARSGLEEESRPQITWPAREFALVQSVGTPDGVQYRVIESVLAQT